MGGYSKNVFSGRTSVLATKHAKEKVITPLLVEQLHVHLVVPQDFDSDQFGTFTGERPRKGNQLETARAKAYAAMDLLGVDLGIASEGSFGPDPNMPFVQSNLELVLLVDRKNDLEIRGHHRSNNTNASSAMVTSVEEALRVVETWGFPEHKVIARVSPHLNTFIYKGIGSQEELQSRVEHLLSMPLVNSVHIETDMRADCNPTRMENIQKATEDLVKNCLSVCPKCHTPGFIPTETIREAVCRLCRRRTDRSRGVQYTCFKCSYVEERLFAEQTVDPAECGFCNP